jgi:tight adherence protein B
MAPIFYVIIFVAVVFAVEGIYFLVLERRADASTVRRRLRALGSNFQATAEAREDSLLRGERSQGVLTQLLAAVPKLEGLGLLLYRAGYTIRPERFVLLSVALGVGAWFAAATFLADPYRAVPFLGVAFLPFVQARRRAARRMAAFEQQFPEALELLTRAMRAGHSLSFGLQMIGEEMPDPIGTEFAQVAEEVKLGQDVRQALANLSYRVDAADLPFFITAIVIQATTGGNLAEILDKLGYVIRERFKLYGKVRALTAMGRMSANLLACWPLVMVGALYMVSPGYVEPLWTSDTGPLLVLSSAVLVVIGYVICRRMATIEV